MSSEAVPRQTSSFENAEVASAVAQLAEVEDAQSRGAIFTRREVVDFILDLVDYTESKPLQECRLLEPSFGAGDFLLPAVERLVRSWRAHRSGRSLLSDLRNCIRAVEVHRPTFLRTQSALISQLTSLGIGDADAAELAASWLIQDDFLLTDLPKEFDVVVGNPPYVRQELIPPVLLAEYRARYKTLYDRADLYVPFIERSLLLLAKGGRLGFICADRWMKNKYGGPLRGLVSRSYNLRFYVDMVGTDSFLSEVSAYPAITIISRETAGKTRIAHRPTVSKKLLSLLASDLRSSRLPTDGSVIEIGRVTQDSEPWMLDSSASLALVRRIEAEQPTLEAADCKVGIGVATGADKAFIGLFDSLDVEPSRKLPLIMTRDINDGKIVWRGFGVINPFLDGGGLVDLDDYPLLRRYLYERKDVIAGRHCAQKTPDNWYRTIDRITPALASTPKLLIPDIKGAAQVVYEPGRLYPHHNLYFITSKDWDLRALQAVLISGIARLFVSSYSTHMRGGYLRFQAQYLRRIRLPYWGDVSATLRKRLRLAGEKGDFEEARQAVSSLYGLSEAERKLLV